MFASRNKVPHEINPQFLAGTGIPHEYYGAEISAVPPEGASYVAKIQKYLDDSDYALTEGIGLHLCGPSGTGKTSLAVYVAKMLKSTFCLHYGVRFVQMQRFGELAFKEEVRAKIRECSLLILDDLGSEYVKDYGNTMLDGIIRYRGGAKLPTIITTNLLDDKYISRYGENITDYIAEKCPMILVTGVRWRKDKKDKVNAWLSSPKKSTETK